MFFKYQFVWKVKIEFCFIVLVFVYVFKLSYSLLFYCFFVFYLQVFQLEFKILYKKFEGWVLSKWNLCDVFVVLLFFIGFGFCMSFGMIEVGYIFYCIDIMLWIVWVFDIFFVSKVLGLYVVMIG